LHPRSELSDYLCVFPFQESSAFSWRRYSSGSTGNVQGPNSVEFDTQGRAGAIAKHRIEQVRKGKILRISSIVS
jgi:hypothetical protein